MTITIWNNKPPDRKWGWSVDDVMLRRDWGFKKRRLWSFLPSRHADEFFGSRPAEMNWDLKHHKMRRMLGWGQQRILRIVSLSTYHHGPKPEINKTIRIWNDRIGLYLYKYLYYYYWHHQIIQHYVDIGCTLEDLPGAMDDRDRWRERESQENPCCDHNLMMRMNIWFYYFRNMLERLNISF